MFDKDIIMLQVRLDSDTMLHLCCGGSLLSGVSDLMQAGASMMDPNHFLMIVLSRFELFHVFSTADIRKRYREANKVSAPQRHCKAAELPTFMLRLFTTDRLDSVCRYLH